MSSGGKHVCEACGQPASFRCPKCAKLGLPDSYFCGDKCFRGFWNLHKVKHNPDMIKAALELQKEAKACADIDERFAGYTFTGKLRNAKVSPKLEVPAEIPRPDYAETGTPTSEIAAQNNPPPIQTAEQIAGMRAACAVAREVLDIAAKAVRPGITTDEIDKIVHEATIARGAYPSPLNYYGFPKSVCTSVNEVICHGIPDSRKLENGDIVNIDVTVYYKGYHGDVNETYPVGEVDEESKKLIQAAYDGMMKGIRICKPGVRFEQIGDVIGNYVHKLGFTADRHYCGHGIGTLFHTNPNICHYPHNKTKGVMKAGNIFTIEPMINAGHYADRTWPDEWTVVTSDGKRSAQFENTILITETGYEILTARTPNSYQYWFETK